MADYQKIEIKPEETPAYTEEQVQQVEQEAPAEVQEESAPIERPEWLPEKFNSPEDLAKAYGQLEQEFSRSKTESGQAEAPVETAIESGLFGELTQEFDNTGDVSEASKQKLVDQGIPREFIDSYVAGQQQLAEASVRQAYEMVGGEEEYQQMLNWATENLSDNEVTSFNNMVAAGEHEQKMVIESVYNRYKSSNAGAPPLIQGDTGKDIPNSGAYQSRAQVVAAMKDPRYKTDSAYRQQVYTKLSNSNVF